MANIGPTPLPPPIGPTPKPPSGSGQGPSRSQEPKGALGSRHVEQKSPNKMNREDVATGKAAQRVRSGSSPNRSQSLILRIVSGMASTMESIRFSKAAISLFGTPGKMVVTPARQLDLNSQEASEKPLKPEEQAPEKLQQDKNQVELDINRSSLVVDGKRLASGEHQISPRRGIEALKDYLSNKGVSLKEQARIFSMFQQQSSSFFFTDIHNNCVTPDKQGADKDLAYAEFSFLTGNPVGLELSTGKEKWFSAAKPWISELDTEEGTVSTYTLVDRNVDHMGIPQPDFPKDQFPDRILYRTTYNYRTNEYKIDRLDPRVWDRRSTEIDKMEQFGGLAPKEQQPPKKSS